jgi:hypothetical protein
MEGIFQAYSYKSWLSYVARSYLVRYWAANWVDFRTDFLDDPAGVNPIINN